jgi:outer membrane protein assembly factor BamD
MPKRYFAALLLLLMPLMSSCGLIDYYFLPPPEDTAQELFESGMDYMKEKRYGRAAENFLKLKDRYPFSPLTPKAEIALGDAYFMDVKYPEAVESYKEFESLHPSSPEIPYVLFQMGLANLNQFRTIDLRQDNVKEALEIFYRLEESHPNSPYTKATKEYIYKGRKILAEHEIFVADFFWRTSQFGPAWHRYLFVLENYGDVAEYKDYARKRAEYSYFEYQKALSEEERERVQWTWKRLLKWL